MAQYKAFNPDVMVNGQTVLSFVNALKRGKEFRKSILTKHGLAPKEGEWYAQQKWLDAFKEVADTVGDYNLFLIGNAIIENAEFPPLEGLEQALGAIDVAYHMNHQLDGEVMFDDQTGAMLEGIGHYSLTHFNGEQRRAIMVCTNPYPSKFDEGIISEIVKRFRPKGSRRYEVKLDETKEQRNKGGESCTYLISW